MTSRRQFSSFAAAFWGVFFFGNEWIGVTGFSSSLASNSWPTVAAYSGTIGRGKICSALYAKESSKKEPAFTVVDAPPDFTIDDDDDDNNSSREPKSDKKKFIPPPMDNSDNDDDDDSYSEKPQKSGTRFIRPTRPKQKVAPTKSMIGTSWMQKNAQFIPEPDNTPAKAVAPPPRRDEANNENDASSNSSPRATAAERPPIRRVGPIKPNDFRSTRVFVQGIPDGISWQDLKDHFRIAGQVAFASVSVDTATGKSKGHGLVQFETADMAQYAIQVMRNHPLRDATLFVREDVQEKSSGPSSYSAETNAARDRGGERGAQEYGGGPPSKWSCANDENTEYMDEETKNQIWSLVKARDDARKRKKFDISDKLRDSLKQEYGVFIDDRLKLWWTSVDGSRVPQTLVELKGDGRWGKQTAWRQIPTTPENDASINPDMVQGLLRQRDVARREKDFGTADSLLEQARTAPDGDLVLRIHDESRTWRIWTEAPPPKTFQYSNNRDENDFAPSDPEAKRQEVAQQCMEIVKEFAPEKVEEITSILTSFPGREFSVLKKLKKRYLEGTSE
jgi:hypothetical protein